MTTIFRSDRTFFLVGYYVSHGPLLFRSGKTNEHDTRLDVLFYDVRAMEVRVFTEGLIVGEEDPEYLSRFPSRPLEMMEPGLIAYSIGNGTWSGYVLAGSFQVGEDRGELQDPSPLLADDSLRFTPDSRPGEPGES